MGAAGSGEQALVRSFNDTDESIDVTVVGGNVTLQADDVEIGAVEIKDATGANRAAVDTPPNIDETDVALAVHDDKKVKRGSLTDRSGTVITGGTRQQVMAANANRNYLLFQNVSTGDLWIRFGANANADQPSILVPPRMAFVMESSFVDTDALDVMGATTGQAFSAKEG